MKNISINEMFNLFRLLSLIFVNEISFYIQLVLSLSSLLLNVKAQSDNGGGINHLDYKGAFIGKLNSYAHQVSGEVYAIDQHTFLLKDFFYDGLATGIYSNLDFIYQFK